MSKQLLYLAVSIHSVLCLCSESSKCLSLCCVCLLLAVKWVFRAGLQETEAAYHSQTAMRMMGEHSLQAAPFRQTLCFQRVICYYKNHNRFK